MPDFRDLFHRSPLGRMLRNPLMQRVIRNSGYLFSGTTLSAALSMVQGILAARLLVMVEGPQAGVAAYGLLGTITVFASVLNRLTSSRMGEFVVNFVGRFSAQGRDRHAAAAFKIAGLVEIGSSLLAFGLIVLLAPLGARFLAHDPATAPLFVFYGLMVLANLIAESSTGLLQQFNRFRALAIIGVSQSVLTLGLIAAAFLLRGGLEAVVFAYLVGKVVWAVAVSGAAMREARGQWGGRWWAAPLSLLREDWRSMMRFAVSTNLTSTLTLVTRDSEILWLGALSSPLQVGYYKIALAIMNILLIPIQPLISTTYREVTQEIAGRRWENVRYLLRSGSLLAAAYSVLAALGLGIFGPWLVSIYGVEFLPTSYHALLILLIGVTVVNIFYWNRTVLLPLGHPEYPTKVSLVGALIKVAGTLLLVPQTGAVGMAMLLSAFFLGTGTVLVWKTYRELRISEAASPVLATS